MIDQILKSVLEGRHDEIEKYKKDATGKVLQVFRKYWKYLAIAALLVLIAIIAIVWALWAAIAGVAGSVNGGGADALKKVEEVGINGIIEEPLQIVRDIWYGKDGK